MPNEDGSGLGRRGDTAAWSVLMARAQDGDSAAYRQLLYEISGYLRSLAAAHHRIPADIETGRYGRVYERNVLVKLVERALLVSARSVTFTV